MSRKADLDDQPIDLTGVEVSNSLAFIAKDFINLLINQGYTRSDIRQQVYEKTGKQIKTTFNRLEKNGQISYPFLELIASAFDYNVEVSFSKKEPISQDISEVELTDEEQAELDEYFK